nr:hypothetical protein [Deltaproteobacteria bacterium]
MLEPPPGADPPAGLTLELLDADAIEQQSHGGISSAQTLHYRTLRPEPGGLLCEEVFGPQPTDWTAPRLEFSAQTEPFAPPPRTCRFGHIELATPVLHPMVGKHQRDRVATDLGLDPASFERILATQQGVVTDPGDGDVETGTVLGLEDDVPPGTTVGTGAAGLAQLYEEAWGDGPMFLRRLPVLPAGLRPLYPLDEGRFATSDLNHLYGRVIGRNDRTRRLQQLDAPALLLRSEARLLQAAVDALFFNHATPAVADGRDRRLQSLWDLTGLHRTPWERLDELQERARE